jgi:hypothetical protein
MSAKLITSWYMTATVYLQLHQPGRALGLLNSSYPGPDYQVSYRTILYIRQLILPPQAS